MTNELIALLAFLGPILVGLIDWYRWRKTPKVQDSEAQSNISEAYERLNQRFEALSVRHEHESDDLRAQGKLLKEQVALLENKVKILVAEKDVLGVELLRQKNEYETRLIELSKRLQSEIAIRVGLQRQTEEQEREIQLLKARIKELEKNGKSETL